MISIEAFSFADHYQELTLKCASDLLKSLQESANQREQIIYEQEKAQSELEFAKLRLELRKESP